MKQIANNESGLSRVRWWDQQADPPYTFLVDVDMFGSYHYVKLDAMILLDMDAIREVLVEQLWLQSRKDGK